MWANRAAKKEEPPSEKGQLFEVGQILEVIACPDDRHIMSMGIKFSSPL